MGRERGGRGLNSLLSTLRLWADDLDRVIFPRVCMGCGRTLVGQEKYLCLECDLKLPRTNFHLSPDNPLHRRLLGGLQPLPQGVGKLWVERAAAYFFYLPDSSFSNIIKDAKYHNHPEIDRHFARRCAHEIVRSGFFEGIDALMPVPMHWRKQAVRGYNQAEEVAKGLSDVTGLPVWHHLYAMKGHSTQTHKSAVERNLTMAAGLFAVEHPEELEGRHILVVDDVITTGATLHACCMALHLAAPTATISVAALAATHDHT